MALTAHNRQWAVPDHVVTREVGGTLVLLDVESGRSFALDAVGTRVWTLLTTTRSLDATCQALEADYIATPEDIRRDVCDLVDRLVSGGLLVADA